MNCGQCQGPGIRSDVYKHCPKTDSYVPLIFMNHVHRSWQFGTCFTLTKVQVKIVIEFCFMFLFQSTIVTNILKISFQYELRYRTVKTEKWKFFYQFISQRFLSCYKILGTNFYSFKGHYEINFPP